MTRQHRLTRADGSAASAASEWLPSTDIMASRFWTVALLLGTLSLAGNLVFYICLRFVLLDLILDNKYLCS